MFLFEKRNLMRLSRGLRENGLFRWWADAHPTAFNGERDSGAKVFASFFKKKRLLPS
jgi:hypothetical protein